MNDLQRYLVSIELQVLGFFLVWVLVGTYKYSTTNTLAGPRYLPRVCYIPPGQEVSKFRKGRLVSGFQTCRP